MKRFYFLVLILFTAMCINAQLVISEIMYNSPETGADSLEFIEITNIGNSAYSMSGVKFNAGVTYTFQNYSLPAGGIVVVAVDSVAMKTLFNVDAFQWTGGLNNGGEAIRLVDANDVTLDEVTYDDAAPWPLDPDEGGSSLVLCDLTANNSDGASWSAATNGTGVSINNKEVKGSPGKLNAISCVTIPSVFVDVKDFSFTPKDITVDVGTTVRWTNKGGFHNVNGTQAIFPSNPASFGNGPASNTAWTYDFTFNVPGKYTYHCDPHAPSMSGTVTVGTIKNYTAYSIPVATTTNNEGVMDSVGKFAQLTGTVHGINTRPGSLGFTIIDQGNNGIGVINLTTDLGYQVKEGDIVTIKGTIQQFNGFGQISADEVKKDGTANTVQPKTVKTFVEVDESSLVKIENFNYVDKTQWKGDGTSFNVSITNGTETLAMRIDNDTDLSKLPAPEGPFNIVGILGQFDNATPFTEGYQIFPRYASDITSISNTKDNEFVSVVAYPNPTNSTVTFISNKNIALITIIDMNGRQITEGKNTNSIDISSCDTGIYFAKLNVGSGSIVRKIYKQ